MPESSVHLQLYRDVPAAWLDETLAARWRRIRELRRVVTGALELERAQKRLGSSLQAAVEIFADAASVAALDGVDLPEICITSAVCLSAEARPEGSFVLADVPGIAVRVSQAPGEKCQRCWKVLPEVGHSDAHPDLCGRCAAAVDALAAAEH